MKQLLITYKSFDELTPQQQKTVLDNNREILFKANYHQPILDNMKSTMGDIFNQNCEVHIETNYMTSLSFEISTDIEYIINLVKSNLIEDKYPFIDMSYVKESFEECLLYNNSKRFKVIYDNLQSTIVVTKQFPLHNPWKTILETGNHYENIESSLGNLWMCVQDLLYELRGTWMKQLQSLFEDESIIKYFRENNIHFQEGTLSIEPDFR